LTFTFPLFPSADSNFIDVSVFFFKVQKFLFLTSPAQCIYIYIANVANVPKPRFLYHSSLRLLFPAEIKCFSFMSIEPRGAIFSLNILIHPKGSRLSKVLLHGRSQVVSESTSLVPERRRRGWRHWRCVGCILVHA